MNNGTAIGKKIFETVTGVTVDKAVAGAVKVGVSGGDLTINGTLNNSGTATLDGKFVLPKNAGNIQANCYWNRYIRCCFKETIFGVSGNGHWNKII